MAVNLRSARALARFCQKKEKKRGRNDGRERRREKDRYTGPLAPTLC